jgi:hypothetical protein
MSLKSFHLVFIIASVALMAFLSAWNFLNYRESQIVSDLAWGFAAGVAVVGLIIYGRFFLRKLKNISYL